MTRLALPVVAALALAAAVRPAVAQTAQPQPLRGLTCLSLNLTPAQMADDGVTVAVLAGPRADAKQIGTAPAGVLAPYPLHVSGGFTEIMRANGEKGWVRSDLLRPYTGRCAPVQLPNGRVGF